MIDPFCWRTFRGMLGGLLFFFQTFTTLRCSARTRCTRSRLLLDHAPADAKHQSHLCICKLNFSHVVFFNHSFTSSPPDLMFVLTASVSVSLCCTPWSCNHAASAGESDLGGLLFCCHGNRGHSRKIQHNIQRLTVRSQACLSVHTDV